MADSFPNLHTLNQKCSKKVGTHARREDDREVRKSNLPYGLNPYFTGREAELTAINEQLRTHGKAALYGLGGMGKTQTTIEYVHRYQTAYEWILWVNADAMSLAASFGKLAETIGLPEATLKLNEQVEAVGRWLRTRTAPVLLIFNNADEPELLKPYLPNNLSVRVLLTSRASVFDGLGISQPIALKEMTSEQSIVFLFRRTDRSALPAEMRATDPEFVAAKEVAQELGGLPLALEQAGAFMRELEVSFRAYLNQYRELRLELLEEQKPVVGSYPESVRTTWTLNFQAVARRSLASAQVLELSAFLAAEDIPYELLTIGAEHLGEEIQLVLAGKPHAEIALAKLLKPLADYSLIWREREKQCYSIHQLVQEVLRDRMSVAERQQWVERTVIALKAAFPYVKFETWKECSRLLTHVQIIYLHSDNLSFKSLILAGLLSKAGYYLHKQGRYSEAEPLHLKALSIQKQQLGDIHPDVAISLNNLASLYKSQGRYSEAEPLHLKALSIQKQQLGDIHPDVAISLNNLALVYESQGRYSEAEPLHLQALAIQQQQLGDIHPDVANSFNNLASLYEDQGRYSEAEPLYIQALTIQQQQLGDIHPDVAQSLNNLSSLYQAQGRYSESESLQLQALEISQQQLGDIHPNVANSFNNLASLYEDQGRYSEAEPLHLKALSIRQQQLGDIHPDVAQSLNNLASLYESQGRYSEAEPLHLQSLSIRQQQLGDIHPGVAISLNNLAALYKAQGRYSEAEPLYLRALSIGQQQLGDDHPNVATRLNNLASLYEDQGRYSEAEPLHLKALSIRQQQLGDIHPDVAQSLNNLASLYESQGRYSEAEPLHLQSLSIRQQQLGDIHPHVAISLNNLASVYRLQGRYSEAEPLHLQALSIQQQQLGDNHPDVATSLNNLALIYYLQERYGKAEPLYLQALTIQQQQLSNDHPDIAANFNNLAALYQAQGRYSEAELLFLQALRNAECQLGKFHPTTMLLRENLAQLYAEAAESYKFQGHYEEVVELLEKSIELRNQQLQQ